MKNPQQKEMKDAFQALREHVLPPILQVADEYGDQTFVALLGITLDCLEATGFVELELAGGLRDFFAVGGAPCPILVR
jgi:hypothetical protein